MNLSQFKLQGEDENSYTVAHPNGKSMTIAKQGMSPKAQEVIKNMGPQKLFDGGDVADESSPLERGLSSAGDYLGNALSNARSTFDSGSQAAADSVAAGDAAAAAKTDQSTQAAQDVVASSPYAPIILGAQNTPPANGTIPGGATPAAAVVPSAPDPYAQNMQAHNQALEAEQKALQDFSASLGASSGQSTAALKQFNDATAKLQTPEQIIQAHKAKDDELTQAFMQGRVDPNRLLNSQGAGNKITSAIGVLLSGIGSGLTGQPNLAMQVIHDNIQRDIESQQNDQSNKMTLWKMNREATGSDIAATLQTQNMMYAGLQAKLQAAAATATTAQGKLAVANGLANIGKEMADNRLKQAMLSPQSMQGRTPQSGATAAPDQAAAQNAEADFQRKLQYYRMSGDENTAKMMEARHIAGVPGLANRDIPEDDRKSLLALNSLEDNLNRSKNYLNTQASSTGKWLPSAAKAQGDSLMGSAELSLNQLFDQKRFTPEEHEVVNRLRPNLTGTQFTGSEATKADELLKTVRGKRSEILSQYGMTAPGGGGGGITPQTKIVNGKQIIRGN